MLEPALLSTRCEWVSPKMLKGFQVLVRRDFLFMMEDVATTLMLVRLHDFGPPIITMAAQLFQESAHVQ